MIYIIFLILNLGEYAMLWHGAQAKAFDLRAILIETIYSMIRRLLRTTYKYIIPPLLLSKFLLAFRLILILIVRVLINDEFLQPLHLIPHLSHQVILPL